MNTLKVLFAAFVMLVSFAACSPNHDEEVTPASNKTDLEKFEVKSTESGNDHSDGGTRPPNP